MVYATGHVKHNALTGETATRTDFSEDSPALASRAWLIAAPRPPIGPRWSGTTEVDDWDDIFTPPADES
jgi:hypothetical protein